ncbi:hypothetical protein LR48_Vigan07g246000 [Vigna angularis]|uniref:Copper transport protein n=2 Tax=Phaseolus angularis TaxID=3914 RepID=A0A0L9V1C6_PHAAN|nr:copper transporter 5.1 [Vigna angularis]KAG2390131.1 Copper transporter [Vigna angularis]KOM48756.1 hypothetical protein LR48_Vigan07g246000 [Vigna angularis]BAT82408.1 hypothetical protein VIGAN_03242100 [Vigna angularis var. angularis]
MSYLLSLFACLVIATFYQYLENCLIHLKLVTSYWRPSRTEIRIPLLCGIARDKRRLGVKLAEAVLFGVNSGIGFLLMLTIMSFNGGVLVAVVVGLTIGYFLFKNEEERDDAIVVDSSCASA